MLMRCLLGTGQIGGDNCGVFVLAIFGVFKRLRALERFWWFLGRDMRIS